MTFPQPVPHPIRRISHSCAPSAACTSAPAFLSLPIHCAHFFRQAFIAAIFFLSAFGSIPAIAANAQPERLLALIGATVYGSPTSKVRGKVAQVAPGYEADLVLLRADPAADIRNFANVAYTIRAGKIIYTHRQHIPGNPVHTK